MPAHVHLRSEEDQRRRSGKTLEEHVAARGLQNIVAASAGMAPQRLNQLIKKVAPSIEVEKAYWLEKALGLEPGALFVAPKPELLAHYVHSDSDLADLDAPVEAAEAALLAHYEPEPDTETAADSPTTPSTPE